MEFQIGRLVKKKYIIAGIDQRVGVQRDQGAVVYVRNVFQMMLHATV